MPTFPPDASPPPPPQKATYTGRQIIGIVLTILIVFACLPSVFGSFIIINMSWKITILIGLAFLGLAGWLAHREHAWLRKAQIVPGTVVELTRVRGSKNGYSYKPRVQYTAADGAMREFVRSYSSSPAGMDVGKQVAVAYDPTSGDERIVTFGQRYGFKAFIAVIGVGLMLLGTAFVVGRQYVPRIYQQGGSLP